MDLTDVIHELRELRQRVDDFHVIPKITTASLPGVEIVKDPAQPIGRLKPTTFPTYNGDRSTYPAWRKAVLSALEMDRSTFGYTNSRVFLMLYKALEGKAQCQASPYFESGGENGKERPEAFIVFLDRGNWDQTRVTRARGEPQWTNKLTEALGDQWPDETKISLLTSALNNTLRMALASNHLIPDDDFFELSKIVSKIAHQHEEASKLTGTHKHVDFHKRQNHNNLNNNSDLYEDINQAREINKLGYRNHTGNLDRDGDTFMRGINSTKILRGPNGKPLRAKWKTPEQILRLRNEGRCYRYEQRGCNTKICRLLPARKPDQKGPVVNSNDFSNLDPSLYEEDDSSEVPEN